MADFGSFVVAGYLTLLVYIVPSLVAEKRRHRNFKAILVLNIFLGWTLLGWVAALVWASTDNVKPEP